MNLDHQSKIELKEYILNPLPRIKVVAMNTTTK